MEFKIGNKIFDRQEVECYSRVVGFLRPIKQWNDSKQSEYMSRVTFKNYE